LRTLAFGLAAIAIAVAACSDTSHGSGDGGGGAGGQAPSPTSATTGSGGGSSTSTAASSADGGRGGSGVGGAGGGSASSAGGGSGPCLEITPSAFHRLDADGLYGWFEAPITPDQGGMAPDMLEIQFIGAAADPSLDGDQNGTFDLGSGGNTNYSTCSQCVYVLVDRKSSVKAFFQSSGTIDVRADSDTVHGAVDATLTDVTLIEVTFDPSEVTDPVPGGACLHITSAEVVRSLVPPPPAWTCDALFYGDGRCSCGCGVIDVDCPDSTLQSCEFCQDTGSCSMSACPGDIDPTNNALCN
jgi:hypothetical protein